MYDVQGNGKTMTKEQLRGLKLGMQVVHTGMNHAIQAIRDVQVIVDVFLKKLEEEPEPAIGEREKALREAAAIASNATYNGDYYSSRTDAQDDIARWIEKRILALITQEQKT